MRTETVLNEMERIYGDVHAACLYGSQVCGYATADSDYDVIVILKGYEPGVKYTYVEGEIEIAFLGVSQNVFEEDVSNSTYGGFIADRLINPFMPFVNERYLRECEIERKKVIVSWETTKLILKKKEDAKYIDINLLYFPYKKWNKIASVYRPYRYSIENTLRRDVKEKNLKALLPGFKRAIDELDCLKEVYPGWYRILDKFIDRTLNKALPLKLERIKMAEREIERVVARYLTHNRAGDSDRDLMIKEAISKVKREARHLKDKGFSSALIHPEEFLITP